MASLRGGRLASGARSNHSLAKKVVSGPNIVGAAVNTVGSAVASFGRLARGTVEPVLPSAARLAMLRAPRRFLDGVSWTRLGRVSNLPVHSRLSSPLSGGNKSGR